MVRPESACMAICDDCVPMQLCAYSCVSITISLRTVVHPSRTLANPSRTLANPSRTLANPSRTFANPSRMLANLFMNFREFSANPHESACESSRILRESIANPSRILANPFANFPRILANPLANPPRILANHLRILRESLRISRVFAYAHSYMTHRAPPHAPTSS